MVTTVTTIEGGKSVSQSNSSSLTEMLSPVPDQKTLDSFHSAMEEEKQTAQGNTPLRDAVLAAISNGLTELPATSPEEESALSLQMPSGGKAEQATEDKESVSTQLPPEQRKRGVSAEVAGPILKGGIQNDDTVEISVNQECGRMDSTVFSVSSFEAETVNSDTGVKEAVIQPEIKATAVEHVSETIVQTVLEGVEGEYVPDAMAQTALEDVEVAPLENQELSEIAEEPLSKVALRDKSGASPKKMVSLEGKKKIFGEEVEPVTEENIAAVSAALNPATENTGKDNRISTVSGPDPIASARALESVERVEKLMTVNEVFHQAAEAVVETMLVSPDLLRSHEGEIAVQLKPDVLKGSQMSIAVSGNTMTIAFTPSTMDVAQLLEQNQTRLEQHLGMHIGAYQSHVVVKRKKV